MLDWAFLSLASHRVYRWIDCTSRRESCFCRQRQVCRMDFCNKLNSEIQSCHTFNKFFFQFATWVGMSNVSNTGQIKWIETQWKTVEAKTLRNTVKNINNGFLELSYWWVVNDNNGSLELSHWWVDNYLCLLCWLGDTVKVLNMGVWYNHA